MNHRAIDPRSRAASLSRPEIPQTSSLAKQPQSGSKQRSHQDSDGEDQSEDEEGAVAVTEKADSLLASILVYYREAMANPLSPSYPPSFLKDLKAYMETHPSHADQLISNGITNPEQQSSKAASTGIDLTNEASLVDLLFYTIINLARPSTFLAESMEFNAKATFNVMIASIAEGSQVHDFERLLLLSMYLKDVDDCYPLRNLSSSICLEMICANSLPLFARTSILRLILGPGDFIMHHLETRVRLSQKIAYLLKQDSFEDMEFRSLIQRLARKSKLASQTSAFEQLKYRCYRYLDLVISDPTRYCRRQSISAYMTTAQWNDLLDRDLVFYLYLSSHKYQMLLFMEALRVLGVTFSLFSPTPVQEKLLGDQDLNDDVTSRLHLAKHRIYSAWEDRTEATKKSIEHALDLAISESLEVKEPSCAIQRRLEENSGALHRSIQDPGGSPDLENLNQALYFAKCLLQISSIAPTSFVPRILWMTAVCLRTMHKFRENGFLADGKIREATAVCLDVFLSCLVHRNEPRSSTADQHRPVNDDLDLTITLFTLLFPADEASSWRCVAMNGLSSSPDSSVCADFLLRLFEQLLPHLERRAQEETSPITLFLAAVLLEIVSLQIPVVILVRDGMGMDRALSNIADLQRESTLSSSPLWRSIFEPEVYPHPFPVLQSRLDGLRHAV